MSDLLRLSNNGEGPDAAKSGHLETFTFTNHEIRTVTISGEPWFVASDIATVLGHAEASAVTRSLEEDEKGLHTIQTPGGEQKLLCITEPGLYSAILRSRVEAAKPFKHWVTREVLPQIRRTGSYNVVDPAQITRSDLARMVIESESQIAELTTKIAADAPKVDYINRYVHSEDAITITTFGTQHGLHQSAIFDLLLQEKLIFRTLVSARYSEKKHKMVDDFEYRAYQNKTTFDWFALRPHHATARHANGQVRQTLYVRQAFAPKLAAKLGLQLATEVTA